MHVGLKLMLYYTFRRLNSHAAKVVGVHTCASLSLADWTPLGQNTNGLKFKFYRNKSLHFVISQSVSGLQLLPPG
jgi:hypothetical protein